MNQEEPFIAELEITRIIEILSSEYGFDLSGYSRTSLRRRLARIYNLFQINDSKDFRLFMQRKEGNINRVIEELTVNTTEMFRDLEFWEYLRELLIELAPKVPTLRIWHAGCSTGEEVFSMLILLQESGLIQKTRLIATDINLQVLERASSGYISKKQIEQCNQKIQLSLSSGSLMSYFTKTSEDAYQFNKNLLRYVTFRKYNLVNGKAFSKFDLVLCRNVLIYFDQELQGRVIRLFNDSLFNSGLLALGKKETLNYIPNSEMFDTYNNLHRVYQKK